MAVVIARQKMAIQHAEGEHTIFPSAGPQSLPDNLLDHPHIKGGIESGWITVVSAPEQAEAEEPAKTPAEDRAQPRRRRN